MRKIGILLNTSWYIYNFRKNLILELLKHGFEVHAIAPFDEYSVKLEKIGCVHHKIAIDSKSKNPIYDILLLKRLRKVLSIVNPDVLLNFTIKPNVYGSIAARSLGIKCVNNVAGMGTLFTEGLLSRILFKSLFRVSQKKVGTIFFQNLEDMQELTKDGTVSKYTSELLPGSGVNLMEFPYTPVVNKEKGKIDFLLVARMIYPKGIVEIVEASKVLHAKGYNDFKVLLLGEQGVNNPNAIPKDEFDVLCSYDFVEYLGKTDNVKIVIQRSDVVVLPSFYREGTPKSLLESLAIGRPILTTNMPGCKDTVLDGLNGFLCMPKSVSDLANKMERILNLNFEERLKMGEESRKLAESKFNERIVIDKYLEAINKTLRV